MAIDSTPQLSTDDSTNASVSDEQLIAQHRLALPNEAHDGLFNELLARYHVRILRWCYRFTRDRESSADLAQEVLLRAYRSLGSFRGDSRFSTWIYVITRNHCMTALKKRASEPAHIDQSDAAMLPDKKATAAYADIERRHTARCKLRPVLKALTATEARIMMLHYGEDVPLATITRALGLTNRSGAKAYIVSARRKLCSPGRTVA